VTNKQQLRDRIWELLRPMESIAIAGGHGILETGYKNGGLRINAKALMRTVS
jgi:hypothetical protein